MDIDDAWNSYIKSYKEESIKKASIDEKLDVMTSQLNELQTDVTRLAEVIPEMQGDAAALDAAAAGGAPGPDMMGGAPMMPGGEAPLPPMEGDAGGPIPGEGEAPLPEGEEEALLEGGEEEIPVGEEGEAPAPAGDVPLGIPPDGEAIAQEGEGAGEGGDDLDDYLNSLAEEGVAEDMPPEGAGGQEDVAAILKRLIAEEDDPAKLAELAKALMLAMGEGGGDVISDVPETPPMEGAGDIAPYVKSDSVLDSVSEGESLATDAVETELDDGPEEGTESAKKSAFLEGVMPAEESSPEALAQKLVDALVPILAEIMGAAPPAEVTEVGEVLDESPVDNAPIEEAPIEDIVEVEESSDEEKADEEGDEEKPEEKGDEEESEEKDDEKDDDEKDEDSPEESACDDSTPFKSSESEPVEKSFKELYMDRIGRMRGSDGKVAKAQESTRTFMDVSAYSLPNDHEDGGGRRITPLKELEEFQKSNRPDVAATINGDISRPELSSIAKSESSVSFKDLLEAPDRHKLMEKDWMEYNLFKSRY